MRGLTDWGNLSWPMVSQPSQSYFKIKLISERKRSGKFDKVFFSYTWEISIASYFSMLIPFLQRNHWLHLFHAVVCMPPTDSYSRRRVINITNSEPKPLRAYLVLRKSTYKRQHATPQVLALLLVFREINFILGTALSNLCIITQRQCQLDQPGSGHTLQTPFRKYLVLYIWKWSWTSGLPLKWTHSFIMTFSMLMS